MAELNPELSRLKSQLNALHKALRNQTKEEFNRINPFYEDLIDWKERGAFWEDEDRNITVYNSTTINGEVSIGDNTWIGPFCSIDGTAGLKIGRFCSISAGTHIVTHDTAMWALTGGKSEYTYGPISIGDFCYVGTNAVITRNVSVGDRCVIGAGAVVTKDVPDQSIVAGVPARIIGRVILDNSGGVSFEYFPD